MRRLHRRDFITHSGLAFTMVGLPVFQAEGHPDRHTWEAVMGRTWGRPAKLDSLAGVRPRLLLNDERLERIKRQIGTTHKHIWEVILEKADAYLKEDPPLDHSQQEPMRRLGRGIPWQAMAFTVTGERKYLEGAKRWVLGASELPRWQQNHSLAGGECLFGVAIGYDWLYQKLTPAERELVKGKLAIQAKAMKEGPPQHHDRWLTNHGYVEHLGLAAAAFAVCDEVPEATTWMCQSDLFFQAVLEFAADDGSSHEGHQYWGYATESLLRYLELARDLLGSNYYQNRWLQSVPSFVIQSTLPDFSAENCVMSFGDSHRDYGSHGPTHILYRLAAEYRDGHAQWLAREMDRRSVGRGDYCTWTSLLRYDDTLNGAPLTNRPTFWNCRDVGWITMRSGWERDAVMVGFKCSPTHGHRAQRYYDQQFRENWPKYHNVGAGHGHPDVNSLQVYAYGKWLAIDPLYERPKQTKTHSTILINGQGQVGEGKTWFDVDAALKAQATSEVIRAGSHQDFDYLAGDGAKAYPTSLGLVRFDRHVLYAKPDVILLLDDLEGGKESQFDWLLQVEENVERISNSRYVLRTQDVAMDVHFLLPATLRVAVDGKCLRGSTPGGHCSILALLHPRRANDPRSEARVRSNENGRFEVEVQTAAWDLILKLDAARKAALVIRKRRE